MGQGGGGENRIMVLQEPKGGPTGFSFETIASGAEGEREKFYRKAQGYRTRDPTKTDMKWGGKIMER